MRAVRFIHDRAGRSSPRRGDRSRRWVSSERRCALARVQCKAEDGKGSFFEFAPDLLGRDIGWHRYGRISRIPAHMRRPAETAELTSWQEKDFFLANWLTKCERYALEGGRSGKSS